MPDDLDEKTGLPVEDVLRSKHPCARSVDATHLHQYDSTPAFVDLNITPAIVEHVARQLRGAAGLGGSDSTALSQWLTGFGSSSDRLRSTLASVTRWLANGFPPWAAYRALMSGRLLALDKCPGVRPIGIGETWRRAIAKCVLHVAGKEASASCGVDQLCAGLQAGIDGAIHAMQHEWDIHHMEENWGFLLIDARNAFNELNCTAMLWTVHHEWPSSARFTFNSYRHWTSLVIRCNDGTGVFLHGQEGVTQGDPLSMFAYGVGVLPLIRQLKAAFPRVKQPWYADDAAAAGHWAGIRDHFHRLTEIGPRFGYFPEPSKCVLIVTEDKLARAQLVFADLGFKVVSGARYLGGFIGESASLQPWIAQKVSKWASDVDILATAARAYPQAAYAGLQKSLQQEWQFVQRVTRDVGSHFNPIVKALHGSFLPALFGDNLPEHDPIHTLAGLPVKQAGLALPHPRTSAAQNYKASTLLCAEVFDALTHDDTPFSPADHASTLAAVHSATRAQHTARYAEILEATLRGLSPLHRRTISRAKDTGAWLWVMPSSYHGTDLSAQEFRDALHLRYARTPPDLPSSCDGCGQSFTMDHALECQHGGLVIIRHNEVRDELVDLASRAFSPSAVCAEPLIYPGRSALPENSPVSPGSQALPSDERGDMLIRGLWSRGTDCILDIRVANTDAKSYRSKAPPQVLASHESSKKKRYLQPCLAQRRHFTPFVVSVDGLLGKEAQRVIQTLAGHLAHKSERPYSQVCAFIRARLSIAIVRATHMCLRGSRIPTTQMSRRPLWEASGGLGLFPAEP